LKRVKRYAMDGICMPSLESIPSLDSDIHTFLMLDAVNITSQPCPLANLNDH
jgi:hypothetical protein